MSAAPQQLASTIHAARRVGALAAQRYCQRAAQTQSVLDLIEGRIPLTSEIRDGVVSAVAPYYRLHRGNAVGILSLAIEQAAQAAMDELDRIAVLGHGV